jgi:hypothetical protein
VVLAAHSGVVDTILVAGEVVKRTGRPLADVVWVRELSVNQWRSR